MVVVVAPATDGPDAPLRGGPPPALPSGVKPQRLRPAGNLRTASACYLDTQSPGSTGHASPTPVQREPATPAVVPSQKSGGDTAAFVAEPRKPVLALRLDDAARAALFEAAQAATLFADIFGDATQGKFERVEMEDLQMDFVLCSRRMAALEDDVRCTLQDDLRRLVEAAASAAAGAGLIASPMAFVRFELYQPDKTILVARYKLSDALMALRKAAWRICRAAGVAFPDALWMPHVKLGRIKGLTRGQLDKLSCSALAARAPQPPAAPLGLTLLHAKPEGADENWQAWEPSVVFATAAAAAQAMPAEGGKR
eukprot:TRINITY_DN57731_c0_g1_i1.p1 TRINITY_DN57731_c0_g1~~TRINITY_DN57731_c0_g1_i1.p1  ORF type:complete len:311 (-),score=58.93 TRINITY_DN57731_c0_g1_i1:143-1075(-)